MRKKKVEELGIIVAVILFGMLLWVAYSYSSKSYLNIPCPKCGVYEVAELSTDSITGVQHFKCYECDTEFTMQEVGK